MYVSRVQYSFARGAERVLLSLVPSVAVDGKHVKVRIPCTRFLLLVVRWHTERQITEEDSYSDTHATHVCVVVNCVYVHRHLQDNRECIACDNA